jgi:hypothetical protein
MAAIPDDLLIFADDARMHFVEEVREELTGESSANWALLLTAFVLGAIVATMIVALRLRKATETARNAESQPAPGG